MNTIDTDKPMVSIMIPVYNGANYMREAIDSALAQSYPNIEVIVVNDGSVDETEEIALSYGDKIRYFHKENGGVATALNLAIQEMRGEYFSWLSHDDFYYTDKVKEEVEALLENNNEKGIAICNYDVLKQSTGAKTTYNLNEYYHNEQIENGIFMLLQSMVGGCTLLIHKSHFERVGTFDVTLKTTQDYDLWYRMFRGIKLTYIPKSLVVTRVHAEQGSQTLVEFNPERENLYMNFLHTLTEKEITEMYGSYYTFYYKLIGYFKANNMLHAYQYVYDLFEKEETPDNIMERIEDAKQSIAALSNGKAKSICIFGAGDYGRRVFFELKNRGIPVEYFIDNNSAKWDKDIEGIRCKPIDFILRDRESVLVIAAAYTPGEMVQQLKDLGFPYITTKIQIDKIMYCIPPLRSEVMY